MNSLVHKWLELEFCFGPEASHARRYDLRKDVDWDELEEYVRIGGLATACAMLEAAGLKGHNDHIRLLFELRNAVIHNDGDIAKNNNKKALQLAQDYLAKKLQHELSPELRDPFFSLNGSQVRLSANLYYAIRLCMLDT